MQKYYAVRILFEHFPLILAAYKAFSSREKQTAIHLQNWQ